MTDADPQTPPNEDGLLEEEARESGGDAALVGRGVEDGHADQPSAAADRLLPPFLLVQAWEPRDWDLWKLMHWGECYLFECGNVHLDSRLAMHDHGRILALVVNDEGE